MSHWFRFFSVVEFPDDAGTPRGGSCVRLMTRELPEGGSCVRTSMPYTGQVWSKAIRVTGIA